MEESILKSTKKNLNVVPDDHSFDLDIMTHINAAFSILTDLGVGPVAGFVIEDEVAEWDTYLSDDLVKLSKVKTYVYLRTKLLFDPPTTSYLLEATKQQIQELEWRLNANREESQWVDPDAPSLLVVDGGDPTGP